MQQEESVEDYEDYEADEDEADDYEDYDAKPVARTKRKGSASTEKLIRCPECNGKIPAGEEACEICGAELESPKKKRSRRSGAKVTFGGIFSAAWEQYKENLGALVGVTFCANILSHVLTYGLLWLIGNIARLYLKNIEKAQLMEEFSVVQKLVLFAVAVGVIVIQSHRMYVLNQSQYLVASRQNFDLGISFNLERFLPYLLLTILVFCLSVSGAYCAFKILGNKVYILQLALFVLPAFFLPMAIFWGSWYHVFEQRISLLDPITKPPIWFINYPLITAGLISCSFLINLLGLCACGIGMLFSTPLTGLLWANFHQKILAAEK